MTAPSSIAHRGMTVEISDELTFRIASLLWEDLSKLWAGNGNVPKEIPKDAPKPALHDVMRGIVPVPETQVYINTQPSPPLQLTPENKPVNRTLGGKGYTFIRNAKTLEECFIKFPNVARANIERIWYNSHTPVEEEPKEKVVIEPRKGYKKGGAVERWTEEEIELLQIITPVDKAILHYRDKFPQSTRNDNAVRQKFNKIHHSLPTLPSLPTNPKPLPAKSTPKPDKANKTQLGSIILPDELKPLEEKKAFFIGAQVKQVAGRTPHAMGTGDIIEIKANGDIVVEFYHERKTLKRDEIAFYTAPHTSQLMKVRT